MAGEWAEEPYGTWNAAEGGAGAWEMVTDEAGEVYYRNSATGGWAPLIRLISAREGGLWF